METLRQIVDDMVRDQHGVIAAGQRDRAIEMALMRYSFDAPRTGASVLVWPLTGYACPLPAGWEVNWRITAFYRGAMPVEGYVVEETATGFDLRLLGEALRAGTAVTVHYTRPHEAQSVPEGAREGVCAYAAHLLFKQLAAYFSGERESTIGAVDHARTESRARHYAARAAESRAAYFAAVGLADPAAPGAAAKAAAAVAAWPARNPRHKLVRRGA